MATTADLAARLRAAAPTPTAAPVAATGRPAVTTASLAAALRSGGGGGGYQPMAPAAGSSGYTAGPQKPDSILGQLYHAAVGIVPGLAQAAVQGVETAGAIPHLLFDVATGNLPKSGAGGYFERYLPLPAAMAQSGIQAGEDVMHPSRFAQAAAQGQIVNKIINDLAVVGTLAGTGAAAIGAPLAAGAEGAGEAANVAGAGARAAAEGGQAAAAEGAATGGAAAREALANIGEEAPAATTPPVAYRGLGRGFLGPKEVINPETGATARLGYSLARAAQEGGSPELAAQLGRIGQTLENVSKLSNVATGQTLPQKGLELAGKGVGLIPGVPAAQEWVPRLTDWAARQGINPVTGEPGRLAAIARSTPAQRLAQHFSQEGRDFAAFKDEMLRSKQGAARHELEPYLYAQDLGLTPQEMNVAVNATTQFGRSTADTINRARDAGTPQPNVAELVRLKYEGVPDDQRPSPEDIRNLADYLGGRMDPGRTALIDQVVANLRDNSARMAAVKMRDPEHPLNPEQLGNAPLSAVMDQVRAGIEADREAAVRDWTKRHNDAQVAARKASAWEAVRAELPTAPSQSQVFARGRAAGLADAGAQAAAERARGLQRQLETALAEYARDVASGADRELITSRAATVDRLTAEINGLVDMVSTRQRRLAATVGLTRAGTEVVEPGGEPYGAPALQPTMAPKVTELRARVKAHGQALAADLRNELERVTGNRKLALTPRKGFEEQAMAGEFNWPQSVKLTAAEQRRLVRERLVATTDAEKFGNDTLAEAMSQTYGRDMSVDEAAQVYMDMVRQMWRAQGGRAPEAIARVAEETGLSPAAVEAALGSKASMLDVLNEQTGRAFDQMKAEYDDLPAQDRELFVQAFNHLKADPRTTPEDYRDLLASFLPNSHQGGDLSAAGVLANFTNDQDVINGLIGGPRPEVLRFFTEPRSVTAQRQIGARTAEVKATRQALSAKRREFAQAHRDLVRAVREHDANTAAIARRFERLQGEVQRAQDTADLARNRANAVQGFAKPTAQEQAAGRLWQRFRGAPSRGERVAMAVGKYGEQAHATEARAASSRRAVDRANARIADLPNEMTRSWQSRFADVNNRANTQLINHVRRAADELGDRVTGKAGQDRLTGLLNRLSFTKPDEVRAQHYDLRAEVIDALQRAEQAAGNPLSAFERGEVLTGVLRDHGIQLEPHDEQALARSVSRGTLLEKMTDQQLQDIANNVHSNTPRRLIEHIREQGDWMPQESRNGAERTIGAYERSRANFLRNYLDETARAAPARWRTVMMDAHREIAALHAMADKEDRVTGPGAGDHLRAIAEDVPTTIDAMQKAGIDPTYLIGGKPPKQVFTGTYRPGQLAATRTGKQRTTGLGPMSLQDVARTNADEAARLMHNLAYKEFGERFGKRAGDVLARQLADHQDAFGEAMTPKRLTDVARANGWVPHGDEQTITPETRVVPKWMKDQIDDIAMPNGLFWRGIRKANRLYKTTALPLSPKWLVHRSIGNVIQAMVYGGVNPARLAREFVDMSKEAGGVKALWRRGGIPDSTPAEVLAHGLTHGEFNAMYPDARQGPGGPLKGIIQKSFNLNSFVENATRSAVYRAKLGEGLPSSAALRSTAKAMGDFTKLTPFERRYVAQILPFYPWIRHQTQAILRLPMEHPMRAIYLAQLGNMLNDPNLSTKQLIALGSRIPIGGGNFLNMGNVSPLANPGALPLSPLSIGASLSPALKLPIEIGLGINPNQNFKPLARPPQTANTDAFGRPLPTPPWTKGLHGLGEMAYLAAGQVPYLSTLRDVALNPANARYATGYTATSGGVPYTTGKSRLGELYAALNLPTIKPLPQVTGGK
jgi:hypothetical protein